MTSTMKLRWDQADEGLSREKFQAFCQAVLARHEPDYGCWYIRQAQIEWTDPHEVIFSTYHLSEDIEVMADLAIRLWMQEGGSLSGSPECRGFLFGTFCVGMAQRQYLNPGERVDDNDPDIIRWTDSSGAEHMRRFSEITR